MIRRWARAAALACLLTAGAIAPAVAQPQMGAEVPETPEAEAPRQVLVFLRLPPQHYRPGAAYGSSYGDSEGRVARQRVADGLARRHGLRVVSEWPMSSLGVDCFLMSVPETETPERIAVLLAEDPQVQWAQPLQLFHGEAAGPNDPLYLAQPAANAWRLADLHQLATGRRVRVAVIDSMVDAAHPDLRGQVELTQNFVLGSASRAEMHGTGVAGIIAARTGNGVGIAGVAPDARILGLRACWETNGRRAVCDSLSLARALDFAIARRAPIINMSLSGPPDPLLDRLVELALARGLAVVAAFDRSAPSGGFPAAHHGVIAVADAAPGLPSGVLTAPGRDIPTTQVGGRWYVVSGSSYAAAHVSGLLALLRERSSIRHSPLIAAVAQTDRGIDACATLLRRPGLAGADARRAAKLPLPCLDR